MEETEMLEQTNETENVETQTTEEIVDEGIELTDTLEVEEESSESTEEKKEVKKTLRELLEEDLGYQEEFNEMIKGRLARKDREHQRELSKYKDTDNVLRSALKITDDEDVNQKLREVYEADGVELPSRYEPGLSSREIEALANIDVEDIIADGHEAMVTEANRLAEKGYKNLNDREKLVFTKLAEKLTFDEDKKQLLSLGAKEEILKDKDFIDFRNKFNSDVPIKDVYELYKSRQPKPKVENPGSMKNKKQNDGIKDFYTPEEASKFTRFDYDKNPKLLEAVEKSMQQWVK